MLWYDTYMLEQINVRQKFAGSTNWFYWELMKGLLLTIISNVTSNTKYTINEITIRFPCFVECLKCFNKYSSSIINIMHLLQLNDCPLEH
jgi:hypothetical protein